MDNYNKYENSVVYMIKCKDQSLEDCYIGSTIDFENRRWGHKSRCINKNDKSYNITVYQFIRDHGGWDNFEMIRLIKYNCKDKKELHKIENIFMDVYTPSLNSRKASRNPHYLKDYYQKNKAKICEKDKQYYQENKAKISEYRSQKITCECGSTIRILGITLHRKTNKHQNYLNSQILLSKD
jgi:predicted GIY-YIG superfamily endonuclease